MGISTARVQRCSAERDAIVCVLTSLQTCVLITVIRLPQYSLQQVYYSSLGRSRRSLKHAVGVSVPAMKHARDELEAHLQDHISPRVPGATRISMPMAGRRENV